MTRTNRTTPVSRIDRPITIRMPYGLSKGGQICWMFMNDMRQALGNHPRELIRSKLIQCYRDDLIREKQVNRRLMETDCGFIQWLFPLKTLGVNPQAPVVKKNDHKVLGQIDDFKLKMLEHFFLFIEFMGLKYDQRRGTFQKVNAKQWRSWIEHPHNNNRMSRVLISMNDFGLKEIARDFLDFLKIESDRQEDEVVHGEVFRQFSNDTRESCEDYWVHCIKD